MTIGPRFSVIKKLRVGTSGISVFNSTKNTALRPLLSALNWTYDQVMDGVTGMTGAEDLANSYLRLSTSEIDAEDVIDSLVRWQIGKASVAGFVTNVGGAITLPVAVPANLMGTLFFQIQMVAAIAHLRGYDLRNDKVRTLVLGCLVGDQIFEPFKLAGVAVGTKLSGLAMNKISGTTLIQIHQAIGKRLLTKAGTTGVVNFSKLLPFVGGVIGGTFDGVVTGGIANVARKVFVAVVPPSALPVAVATG
jgi:hypothetical protein